MPIHFTTPPEGPTQRKWFSIIVSNVLALLLLLINTMGWGSYGIALFVLTPVFMGMCCTILFGYKRKISLQNGWNVSFQSLGFFAILLFVIAIEGVMCLIFLAPIAILFTWVGSTIGYMIIANTFTNPPTMLLMMLSLIPILGFIEKNNPPELHSVVTSIEIKADVETVWKNVVEFPTLDAPTEILFKTGIAYPVDAKIDGSGVGAIRYCNFTTGSFIEPITVWDPPRLLKFSVTKQPAPMKELSIWDINPPHLNEYFVAKEGQFKLIQLPNGDTFLEGTTWYYHNIRPTVYWQLWSQSIIHTIHERVLKHIKKTSEKGITQ